MSEVSLRSLHKFDSGNSWVHAAISDMLKEASISAAIEVELYLYLGSRGCGTAELLGGVGTPPLTFGARGSRNGFY